VERVIAMAREIYEAAGGGYWTALAFTVGLALIFLTL
jgi:hypothetical protein